MKVCPKCGVPNEDRMVFCSSCKTMLGLSKEQLVEREKSKQDALAVFKSVGSSKAMLALIILSAISLAFWVYELRYFRYVVMEYQDALMQTPGMNDKAFMFVAYIGLISSSLPSILTFIGLFMFYSSSLKAKESIDTKGLSLLKGVSIYLIVICSLLAVVGLLFLQVPILFIIFETVVTLMIVYFSKLSKTLDSIILSVRSLVLSADISSYVIVMNYVMVGIVVISQIIVFFSNKTNLAYGINQPSLIKIGLALAPLILYSMLLSMLKQNIQQVQYNRSFNTFQTKVQPTYVVMEEQGTSGGQPLYKPVLPKIEQEVDGESAES